MQQQLIHLKIVPFYFTSVTILFQLMLPDSVYSTAAISKSKTHYLKTKKTRLIQAFS